ncbi:MAG: type II toxin-antitoxin system HicA family toxin [Phycisphaerales bacterium]|nr:MAG: type II toxin-antitoxin system HicA family toxin [Phycisphaerales bacterium]
MTARLSVARQDLIRALTRTGLAIVRVRGSHHFLRHSDGRRTTVPVHAGEAIGPGLLSKILRDTQLSRTDLLRLLAS